MFLTSPFIEQAFTLIILNECNGDIKSIDWSVELPDPWA